MTTEKSNRDHWVLLIEEDVLVEVDLYPSYDACKDAGDELMRQNPRIQRWVAVPPTYGETIA